MFLYIFYHFQTILNIFHTKLTKKKHNEQANSLDRLYLSYTFFSKSKKVSFYSYYFLNSKQANQRQGTNCSRHGKSKFEESRGKLHQRTHVMYCDVIQFFYDVMIDSIVRS